MHALEDVVDVLQRLDRDRRLDLFVGGELTGADIQLSFVSEAANARGVLAPYPELMRHMKAMQARPAAA